MGTRLAVVKSFSQMRQAAGKKTLISASLAAESQSRTELLLTGTHRLLASVGSLDGADSCTQAEIYSSSYFN
jgi:hypothetical protein